MGKMGKGFYRGVEPVAVVPVKNIEALRQALKATIARGNPTVPQPQRRDDWPPPNDGVFLIAGNTRGLYGWVEDPEQTITFPPGTSVDSVIDRMIAILQEAARH